MRSWITRGIAGAVAIVAITLLILPVPLAASQPSPEYLASAGSLASGGEAWHQRYRPTAALGRDYQ
jgi:hypothetical protein